jgi:flagellar protein FliL
MRSTRRGPALLLSLALAAMPLLAPAGGHGGGGAAEGTFPGYMALSPPLVVNLTSARKAQYLRADIQLYIETGEDAAAVTLHMPRLRDRMITLVAGRDAASLATAEAREGLRTEILNAMREIMTAQTGKPGISALYFTGFIVQ